MCHFPGWSINVVVTFETLDLSTSPNSSTLRSRRTCAHACHRQMPSPHAFAISTWTPRTSPGAGSLRCAPSRQYATGRKRRGARITAKVDADVVTEAESSEPVDDDTFVLETEEAATPATATDMIATATAWRPAAGDRAGDLALVCVIVAILYGLVTTTGRLFSAAPYASLEISTSLSVLPWYAAQSLTRMVAGYFVSLAFALSYAYIAYRIDFAAQALMLVIDVLQSIPLLSFLPGVVLGLIAIFPGRRVGVELAAVLLLFTSMAWNMLLGFYQSLRGIPRDLTDVSKAFRLSPWKRFWTLELPAGAIGLVWNSVISVAGGWFFLISIESFELGNRDFRLPGLGSFLAAAADAADFKAILAGLAVVIAVIVVIDFCIWQPLIAWSAKYTYGQPSANAPRPKSAVLMFLQRSTLLRNLHETVLGPAWKWFVNIGETPDKVCATNEGKLKTNRVELKKSSNKGIDAGEFLPYVLQAVVASFAFAGVCVSVIHAVKMVEVLPLSTWASLASASALTAARVFSALAFSLLWTVPAGVAIGRNRSLSEKLQPIVQIAASVPATALFPFVLLFLAKLGGGLQIGSVALMMLGTMWYVLFNVIAGAQAIPAELFDVDTMYNRTGRWTRWRTLVLPGIFPYLITGIVTAVGGAWNASIVSEYVVFRGGVMKTHGLGSLISEAAASGNYPLLLAATVVMSVLVLLTNRFVWGPLYRLAESKYRV